MHIFTATIFLSAFLIFFVQPLIGKFILPWFGATPGVWATCLLFFQLALLTGYWYAHLLAKKVKLHHQSIIHCAFIVISIIFLQIEPSPPTDAKKRLEVLSILIILGKSIGLPFIILAASTPLLQHWFAQKNPDQSPYHLYAISNLGSLIALLGYPLIFEPALTLQEQTSIWTVCYLIFFATTVICARQIGIYQATPIKEVNIKGRKPTILRRLSWAGHAALGTTLLISITNKASLDISANPLIWAIPLSLYLLSFIITFSSDSGYRRAIWIPLGVVCISLLILSSHSDLINLPLHYILALNLFTLFACCIICHGEAVKQKPSTQYLTTFYLSIAAGGAIGGIAVNLVAPIVFNHHWELHFALLFTIILAIYHIYADTARKLARIIITSTGTLVIIVLGLFTFHNHHVINSNAVATSRNFYGVLQVDEHGKKGDYHHHRSLFHGNIVHGIQFMREDLQKIPTTYFGLNSGVGVAFLNYNSSKTSNRRPKRKVGVIGLGAGVVATYGKRQDNFVFYEINEDSYKLARNYFYFLENSHAEIQVTLGDGRMRLAEEFAEHGSHQFDLLIVDAFSGDAIPTHLLTTEAIQLYLNHLKAGGLLALHITNFTMDLKSVSRTLAEHFKKEALLISSGMNPSHLAFPSDWVIITDNRTFLNHPKVRQASTPWPENMRKILWTDNYINLLSVIK